MLDLLGILLAIALLMVLTWLRAVSAVIVPRLRLAVVEQAEPPAGFADLFDEADRQLRELGFTAPFWVKYDDEPAGSASTRLQRIYRHASHSVLAGVFAPVELKQPNRPMLSLSTVLADDTTISSFAYSAGNACFSGERHRRRNVPAADAAALWQAHFLWRHEFKQADAPLPQSNAQLVQDSEQRYAQMLADLIAKGDLYPDRSQALRFSFGATLRVMWQLLRAPKAPRSNRPVPFERQVALLDMFERAMSRTPTRAMQWAAFATTAALFAAVGAAVWSGSFALALLGVLVVHEGGHFLAMRLLGYRNVQMVLVPLLGGVTTGVERDPNGTHRAIVSLAGPLPGIALGWALLWGISSGYWTGMAAGLGTSYFVAVVTLTLNYLNLLPIPPLDGGHFVQSLVPRGWARVGVVLVGLLAVAGIALAWWLQSLLLGVIVALQLFALRGLWRDAHLAQLLHRQLGESPLRGRERDAQILAAVNAQEPRLPLLRRYVRMTKIRNLVDLRPPRAAARAMLVALYFLPFAVPFFVLPKSSPLWQAMAWRRAATPREDPAAPYRKRAETLTVSQLLESIGQANADALARMNADAGLPESTLPASAPVTEKDLSDAEARLHGKLPDDYRMMLADPHRDAVGLRSPADVKRASETVAGLLVDLTDNGAIHVEDVARNEDHALSPEIVGRMVVVAGADQEWSSLVLVDLSGDAALACCRVLAFEDDLSTAYGSMTQWLRSNYANVEALGEMTRRQQQKQKAAWEESKDWNMAGLLDGLARSRTRSGRVAAAADGPVTQRELAEAGKKLGGLPPDYQEMLALQNGEPILSLLPLAQISALDLASDEAAPFRSTPFVIEDATGKPIDKLAPGVALQNARALIVGAVVYPKPVGGKTRSPWILAVERNGSWRYLDLANRRAYANLRELLHHGYARLQSVSWNDD